MRRFWRQVPNLISGLRLVLVPVLWLLALTGRAVAVGVGLMICGLTDLLDGWLARRQSRIATERSS